MSGIEKKVETNIMKVREDTSDGTNHLHNETVMWSLKVDEIATEKRL